MNYRSNKNNQQGFTLIELLIAIAVFSIGIMAAFTLALGNWRVDKENYNRVMASNLAREGIELVRYVRDSNWLYMDNNQECDIAGSVCKWDSYFDDQMNHRFLIDYELRIIETSPIKVFVNVCNDEISIEDCIRDCDKGISEYCVLQYNPEEEEPNKKFFYHNNVDSNHLTNFKRMISLEAICYDGTTEEVASDEINCDVSYPGYEKIGLRVTSIVGWYSFGDEHNLIAVENLYNWRR